MADNSQNIWVERVLGLRVGRSPATEEGAVRMARGMMIWNSLRAHVDQSIHTLQQAIIEQTKDESDHTAIKANVGKLSTLLENLDDSLITKLAALRATSDAKAKRRLTEEARAIVRRYQNYITSDPLMADIDDNGFVPLDVRTKVDESLKAVLGII